MRTTVDLDDLLMRRLRALATVEGTSLRAVMERLLRAALSQRAADGAPSPSDLPALHLGGPPADLPLDDNSALLEHLERPSA